MKIIKSDEVKEEVMKESPKKYTNPFLSDEENEKVNLWDNQDLYTDKKVMECDLPELLVCYKEGSFHVKDICVDEGIPQGEKFLFDEDKHDDIINAKEMTFLPLEDYNMESNGHIENLDEGIERNLQDLPEKDCKEEDIESLDPNEIKKVFKDDENSESAPEKLKVSEECDNTVPEVIDNYVPEEKISSNDNLLDDVSKEETVSKNMPLLQQDQKPLPSLKFLLESLHGVHDKDQQPHKSIINVEDTVKRPLEGNETKEEEVGTSLQTTFISNENMEEKNTINLNNGKSVNTHQNPETFHEHGVGESSFSVSGLITYSGQIAFSGSVSLRSDSSTTSTRSFAFPILQTEWNSSPVRMAKADRTRLQKQRGWRNGLLCCRF